MAISATTWKNCWSLGRLLVTKTSSWAETKLKRSFLYDLHSSNSGSITMTD